MHKLISLSVVIVAFFPILAKAQDTALSLQYCRHGALQTTYSIELRQTGDCQYIGVRDVVLPDTVLFKIGSDTAREILAEAQSVFNRSSPELPEPDMYVDNGMNVTATLTSPNKQTLLFPEGVHDKAAWILFLRMKYATRVLRWTGTMRDLAATTDHASLRPIYAKKSQAELDRQLVHKMSKATRSAVTHFVSAPQVEAQRTRPDAVSYTNADGSARSN